MEDEEELGLKLPAGEHERLLVLQDRTFTDANELVYLDGGMGAMVDQMRGFLGDRILVNGAPPTTYRVATRPYRMRVLNGSNARIYKLAWSDARPVTVIGTDGGLLRQPEDKPYGVLAPAQRLDVCLDLSDSRPGSTVEFISSSHASGMMSGGMMGGGMGGMMGGRGMTGNSALPAGSQFTLMALTVSESVESAGTLPAQLALERTRLPVTNATRIRRIELSQVMMQECAING